jgi:parallel beta-helix repeat protein
MPSEGRSGTGTSRRRGNAHVAAVLVLLAAVAAVIVPGARAAIVACGTTITSDTKLSGDVGPCSSGGLIVRGDGIKLDLNGHRVFGADEAGDGIGILVIESTGATVTRGTVSAFDGGIVILRGGGNRIENVRAVANIGEAGATTFGDGIVVSSSSANVIVDNEVRSNGPFSGISVIGEGSAGNKISKNTVQNNDIPSNGDEQNAVGVRLEPGTSLTTVKGNVIAFNGLDGVAIFQNSVNNVLLDNTVKANGFHDRPHRKGDGIRVFGVTGPDNNTLRRNLAVDNAGHGIILSLGATSNLLQRNKASRNGILESGATDLTDQNEGCDANTWLRNTFLTRSQLCIR